MDGRSGVRDLPDDIDHGRSAAARAEERKHVDRAVDRPFDILIEQGFEIGGLAFIDRAMQRARKTPEAVLCHFSLVLENWLANSNGPVSVSVDAAAGCWGSLFEA
jgi:hypothetical protein